MPCKDGVSEFGAGYPVTCTVVRDEPEADKLSHAPPICSCAKAFAPLKLLIAMAAMVAISLVLVEGVMGVFLSGNGFA
jgi:hypothetical protein